MAGWIDLKYIRLVGPQLTLFKEKRNDLWNFRCPICGDSDKDRTKCRGYIYTHKGDYMFKCQNCGDSRPFKSLLYIISPDLYKQHKMEVFKENSGGKTRKTSNGTAQKPKFKKRREFNIQEYRIPKELDGFESIHSLPEDHFMVKYVTGRMIPKSRWKGLFWASGMRKIADQIPGYKTTYFDTFPRLLLPFINADGVMTHIQGRAVGKDVPKGSRYYTLEVEDDQPKVYGLDQIVDTSIVKVVEGPIDSLFLSNCVGMGGSDVPWHIFDPANTVFIWDHEPRSKQIIKRMKEAVERGFKICVWGDKIKQKDINDMVLFGHKIGWLERYISDRSYSGLRAKLAITQYEK